MPAVRRWLQRSVLRTGSPPLLASGSCGATRCARFASSAQTGRRKSEVRSALRAPTPRLRCSAPQTSAHCGHGPPSARALPCRTASRRDSAGPLPPCRSASVGDLRRTGRASTSSATATPPAKARAIGRRCALCAAEKRSSTGGARSAHRPSFSRRLSERSSRSERSEFRRASRCCEHRREPPRSGGKHPARRRPMARAFARANASYARRDDERPLQAAAVTRSIGARQAPSTMRARPRNARSPASTRRTGTSRWLAA